VASRWHREQRARYVSAVLSKFLNCLDVCAGARYAGRWWRRNGDGSPPGADFGTFSAREALPEAHTGADLCKSQNILVFCFDFYMGLLEFRWRRHFVSEKRPNLAVLGQFRPKSGPFRTRLASRSRGVEQPTGKLIQNTHKLEICTRGCSRCAFGPARRPENGPNGRLGQIRRRAATRSGGSGWCSCMEKSK